MLVTEMNYRWLQLLLLAVIGLTNFVNGQSINRSITHGDINILVEGWTIKDGLPDSGGGVSKNVFQDSRGFIWIYQHSSLTRFDGKNFKKIQDKPDYPGSFKKMAEDKHGNLWLISDAPTSRVLIFDPLEEHFVTLAEYLDASNQPIPQFLSNPNLSVVSIDGEIYLICNRSQEIWRYDGKRLEKIFDEKSSESRFYLPGPDGLFWRTGADTPEALYLVDANGQVVETFTQQNESILSASFFIDSTLQAWYFNAHTAPTQSTLLSDVLHPIGASKKSTISATAVALRLAINTGGPALFHEPKSGFSLVRYDGKMSLWHSQKLLIENIWPLLLEAGIYAQTANPIITSKDGSFWIPYNGQLLKLRFEKKIFHSLFKGKSVRHISVFEAGKSILVNAYDAAPFTIDLGSKEKVNLPGLGPHYYSTYRDGDNVWLGHFGEGIEKYNLSNQEVEKYALDVENGKYQNLRAPFFLTDSTFLLYSDLGLYQFNQRSTTVETLLNNVETYWIHRDKTDKLWATTDNGLYYLPAQEYYLDSLNNQKLVVQHIYETPEGSFWLSSNQGLIHWEPFGQILQKISQVDGLSNNIVHATYPDMRGILWLSTDYGICAVDPEKHLIQNFYDKDGIVHKEQNYLAHLPTPDGQLFFGGINGITTFHPDSIPLFVTQPGYSIHVGKVELFDRKNRLIKRDATSKTNLSQLTIPPTAVQISIDLAAPHYDNFQLVFQWRIPGVFSKWSNINENHLTISGLPAGKHKLELQAYAVDDPNNIKHRRVYIDKQAFFYQKNWFWLAGMLFVLASGWLFYRWRSYILIIRANALTKKVQERTQELEAQKVIVEEQKQHLVEVNQAKNQLFNNISHEFRTPLSLISAHSEKLLQQPELVKKSSLEIKKHTVLLTEMIDEILSLEQIDSSILPLHKSEEDWVNLVRQQFGLFYGLAQKKQLVYQLEIIPNTPYMASIDQKKVTRILQNLISNAIKYTPEKGQIVVRSEISETELLFSVRDNGYGISAKEQEKIFHRYYQGQISKDTAQPGYGIGLALSAEYAKLMGAKLWVDSQEGEGASFFFSLAKEKTATATATPSIVTSSTATSPVEDTPALVSNTTKEINNKFSHVLIVEDNEELLTFLESELSENYQVTALSNGQKALDFLSENKQIDLIISDVMMPIVDGKELLARVRADVKLGFIPFLMLTALTNLPDKIEAYRLGVDSYLTKPFELAELHARVANLTRYEKIRKIGFSNQLPLTKNEAKLSEEAVVTYDQAWVKELEHIVKKELVRPELKVVDIAYQLHISERTLRSRVRAYTGMKPSEYITKARLNQALLLIQQRKYATISEVSSVCGFKNTRHFAQIFKDEFGKSPSAYSREALRF